MGRKINKQKQIQFSSVTQSCPTLCNPMDCSMPGLPVHHQLPELIQTHIHWVGDAIQPSHPLSAPSPPTFSLSQHQGLFQWISSLHQVAKILEFQLQHQSFQRLFRTDQILQKSSSSRGISPVLCVTKSRIKSNGQKFISAQYNNIRLTFLTFRGI